VIDSKVPAIGTSRNIKPTITEIELEIGLIILLFTDGIANAGERTGQGLDIPTLFKAFTEQESPNVQFWSDSLLQTAIDLDQNRPNDDMSIVVMKTIASEGSQIRKMSVHLPFPPIYPQP